MGRSVQPAVIANGASLQSVVSPNKAIDVGDGEVIGVYADPVGWTAAVLSFAALGADGVTWLPVFDEAGAEVTIAAAGLVTGQYVAIKEAAKALRGLGKILVRSGTSAAAVNQGAARTLQVVIAVDRD